MSLQVNDPSLSLPIRWISCLQNILNIIAFVITYRSSECVQKDTRKVIILKSILVLLILFYDQDKI